MSRAGELVLSCLFLEPLPERLERLRHAAAALTDWEPAPLLLESHGVLVLARRNLALAGVQPPEAMRAVLTAREALDWGLVTRVVPDAELGAAVGALARELAQGPSRAFGQAKRLFHQSTWESLETQMELEAQAIAASGHTEDFRAGVSAFAAKTAPRFRGR